MKVGIVGLEFAGKKSLFSLLTGIEEGQTFSNKKEVGVVNVPDERIDYLTDFYQSKKKVYSQIEFDLIPSIKKESQETNKALIEAKEVDLFALVLRQFKNDNVFHPFDKIDLKHDYEVIKNEFILADMILVENRLERIEKQLKAKREDHLLKEKELLISLKQVLDEGQLLNSVELKEEEKRLIKGFQLLSQKPMFIIINCDEDQIKNDFNQFDECRTMNISVQIEKEIAQLAEDEKDEFLKSLGLKESSLNRLIKFAYNFADLISFITAGEKETHSWTIHNGTNAQGAAGAIHTDFEKGFIRAEVIHYNDLKEAGSEAEAKKRGLYRLEGKEYIVKDGDIIIFRFNV